MLKAILRLFALNILLLPIMLFLPALSLILPRTPEGAMAFFFLGPLSAGFYTLVYSQLSAAPWRRGAEAVRQWRSAQGGMVVTVGKATCWLFGAIFFSYVAEFALLFANCPRALLPLATYSPLAFCWLWRGYHA